MDTRQKEQRFLNDLLDQQRLTIVDVPAGI